MKIRIGEYDVEIKVSRNGGKANKQDAYYFLNDISLWAGQTVEKWYKEGADAIAKEANGCSNDIHSFLEARGLYENC